MMKKLLQQNVAICATESISQSQKSIGDTNNQAAHHMFDTRPLKVQSKRRHMKCSKSWRFKFKQRRPHKGRPRNAHKRIYRGNVKYKHRVVPRNLQSGFEGKMKQNSSTEYPCLFLTSKVMNHTPFSLDKLGRFKGRDTLTIKHFLLSDGMFQIKHKWRFKLLPS
ncbi:unnamed protein product, partial [Arabidopsis halleri]